MKYKIGDKVRTKSLDWYNENKDSIGDIKCGNTFVKDMSKYCGQIATITDIDNNVYLLNIDNGFWSWTDEMIEGLVEEEKPLYEDCCSLELKFDMLTIADNICTDKVEIVLQDYELKKEGDKWFAVKKKKEYPKTYEECCKVLGINEGGRILIFSNPIDNYECNHVKRLHNIERLLICRDAYWKIAGEEMGLGKPWEPDWNAPNKTYYTITTKGNEIYKSQAHKFNKIFAFPTPEIRDAFKENFDVDLDFCKELL